MGLRLGNLKISEVESKHEFTVSDEERKLLESKRQDYAQKVEGGKFHIFDLPQTSFHFSCEEDARDIVGILQKYNSDIKGQINFTWSDE